MSSSFVQVPPQSTGKKIATEYRKELWFDNQSGTISVGDTVTGSVSGASGVVTSVIKEGFAANAGKLYLKEFNDTTFQNNENLQITAVTVAVADTASHDDTSIDVQKVIITDPNNLDFNQKIDRFGATVNTFTDGSPVFGPFGTLTTGEPLTIKSYRFSMDNEDNYWSTVTTGAGSTFWDSDTATTQLDVSNASGDFISRTTNYSHPYSPGIGMFIEWTARFGDTGKSGLRRRMGYYCDRSGIFLEQDSADTYIVLRSDISGSVVDTRVPQSDWNVDRADGTDTIGFNLDLTKGNIFWMDLQWLGAGRVRFGVVEPEGSRLVLHRFENANTNNNYPYMRTASLPLRFEQENVGATISSSSMNVACAVVKHTSNSIIVGEKHSVYVPPKALTAAQGEVPIVAIRPAKTFNGVPNTGTFKGISMEVANTGSSPVIVRYRYDPYQLAIDSADGTWSPHSSASFMEVNTSFDSVVAAVTAVPNSLYAFPDSFREIRSDVERSARTYEIQLAGDEDTQPNLIITAEVIGGGSASASVAINWEELRL